MMCKIVVIASSRVKASHVRCHFIPNLDRSRLVFEDSGRSYPRQPIKNAFSVLPHNNSSTLSD